jgi:hypothetical protein
MYAKVENNKIVKANSNLASFGLASNTTQAQREAAGVYEIVYDNSNVRDESYYINGAETLTFNGTQVISTRSVATARNLNDVNEVNEDGTAMLDDDGRQVVTLGLKSIHKNRVKQQASSLITPTDWYVIKASEVAEYTVPANISTFRAAVRSKSNEMEAAIDAASNVDALAALYVYNKDTKTRPLGDFPKL